MSVTPETLLQQLPPFRNERVLIKDDQRVHDIIEQILKAHEKYAHYYDSIAKYFDDTTTEKICSNIYNFLSKHIKYNEESDEEQTTALPSAILSLKYGDCKHYSLFAAGILDALRRKGKKINWCYRFCSYKLLDKTPHHVFVVVKKNDGSEIWIDAVPGASKLTPLWQLDKQVKNFSMPLYDVVGNPNTGNAVGGASIGYTLFEQLAHAAARSNPLLIAGRGAFLQMVKWNVRAWAKNMWYALQTQGRAFSDPLGQKWYKLGGQWDNLTAAIEEGKDKRMIGGTDSDTIGVIDPVTLTALIAAAAPVVIAITEVIKSAMNKPGWQEGQALYPTTGTTLPGGTTSTATDLLKNPLVLAGGAALLYYVYTKNKKKVSGKDDNALLWLLLLGGGYMLYKKSQQQPPATTEPGAITITDPALPAATDQVLQTAPPETIAPDPVYTAPIVTEESAAPVYYGGGGGGGTMVRELEYQIDSYPIEAMM